MSAVSDAVQDFIVLWAVIDPIGSIPVFVAVTKALSATERKAVLNRALLISACVLVGFAVVGQLILEAMGIPLAAFQISGGLVLFLFALTMIFGDSKPESETNAEPADDVAVFPLAVPSIASPGAMMAVVMLTDNHRHSIPHQAVTIGVMLLVLACVFGLLRLAGPILRLIGPAGASILSRIMGLVLASVAATEVLNGIKIYFELA